MKLLLFFCFIVIMRYQVTQTHAGYSCLGTALQCNQELRKFSATVSSQEGLCSAYHELCQPFIKAEQATPECGGYPGKRLMALKNNCPNVAVAVADAGYSCVITALKCDQEIRKVTRTVSDPEDLCSAYHELCQPFITTEQATPECVGYPGSRLMALKHICPTVAVADAGNSCVFTAVKCMQKLRKEAQIVSSREGLCSGYHRVCQPFITKEQATPECGGEPGKAVKDIIKTCPVKI